MRVTAKYKARGVWFASVAIAGAFTSLGTAAAELPAFQRIDHATINVPHLDSATSWYVTVLGFAVKVQASGYTLLAKEGVTLVLNQATHRGRVVHADTSPGYFHVAFEVEAGDFASTIDILRERGVIVSVEQYEESQNAYFQDPDGNWLEVVTNGKVIEPWKQSN